MKSIVVAGMAACLLNGSGWAQSAVWSGGLGDWFGSSGQWVCVSGTMLVPCLPPNGSSFTAAVGTTVNGTSFTGSVTANSPFTLGQLAVGTGASGSLTVPAAGAGSGAYQITVGSQGALTVSGGGTLSSFLVTGDSGVVTVTGAGSSLTSVNSISVSGPGTMTVQNGGLASSNYGQVGEASGAIATAGATARVSGVGSQWVVNNSLNVGTGGGNGTLIISNSGQVGPGALSPGLGTLIGNGAGSTGMVLVNGGSLGTDALTIGGGGGTGALTMTSGAVSVSGFAEVGAQGTLALDSGTFAVRRGFALDPGGSLVFGIGSATTDPLLNISDAIGNFHGTIDFSFMNGFAPVAGETFNLIFSDGAPDDFSGATYQISGLDAGFQYALLNEPEGLELQALNNGMSAAETPEPDMAGLIGLGVLLAGAKGRRMGR